MTTATLMTTEQIGKALVEKYNNHQEEWIFQNLYAHDIVSVEAMEMPNMPREMRGMEAVLKKNEMWHSMNEVHSSKAEGPLVSESEFSVKFTMDVTSKQMNRRMTMQEIAVYQVKNGKITREQFFYNTEHAE